MYSRKSSFILARANLSNLLCEQRGLSRYLHVSVLTGPPCPVFRAP